MDNDNVHDIVVRGLGKRLGIERADAVWVVAENWAGGSQEVEPSWRVQLGVDADGGIWGAMDLLSMVVGEVIIERYHDTL